MTQTAILPIAGLKSGVSVRATFERSTPMTDGFSRVANSGDFSGAMKEGPGIVRNKVGGYSQQIASRAHFDVLGRISNWVEPAYAKGRLPAEAVARENVIWSAALGGLGGGEASGKDWFEVWIDDNVVKAASTALGNQLPVPAGVSYAAFVTGGIGVSTLPMKRAAIAAKPSKRVKPRSAKERFAMYWFLKLAYKYKMTDEELLGGLYTPPKRIGYNPQMATSLSSMLSLWIRRQAGGKAAA